jgi:rhamnosyl/mannosyltransferase
VNSHGTSGLVVPPGDAAALGDALRRLLEDAALRENLGAGARRRAEAMFSRERMVATFKNVVDTAVRSPELLPALEGVA